MVLRHFKILLASFMKGIAYTSELKDLPADGRYFQRTGKSFGK